MSLTVTAFHGSLSHLSISPTAASQISFSLCPFSSSSLCVSVSFSLLLSYTYLRLNRGRSEVYNEASRNFKDDRHMRNQALDASLKLLLLLITKIVHVSANLVLICFFLAFHQVHVYNVRQYSDYTV